MNLVNIPDGMMSIPFSTGITIDGTIYEGLVFITRLLSYEELSRIYSLTPQNSIQDLLLEDDIFDIIYCGVVGFDGQLDKELLEGGVISTIVGATLNKSMDHIHNITSYLGVYEEQVSFVDSLKVVVCKGYSMSLSEVESLPINKLYKLFAAYKKTFPNDFEVTVDEPEQ